MAQSLNNLGVLYREQGNLPEAERLLSKVWRFGARFSVRTTRTSP